MTDRVANAVRTIVSEIGAVLPLDLTIRLWDGGELPLNGAAKNRLTLRFTDPHALTWLIRRPSLDRLIQFYAKGGVDLEGGTFVDFAEIVGVGGTRKKLRQISRVKLVKAAFAILRGNGRKSSAVLAGDTRAFDGDEAGRSVGKRDEGSFIRFHYDVGNAFYALFLDESMVYSCAYFTDWANSLDEAQHDKIDLICRKLRLRQDETLLDIGCGWGALLIHAAKHYGVRGYGVTLSVEQHKYAVEKIAAMGLSDRITIELKPYGEVTGTFDKIVSVGMYEHIGIANYPAYFGKIKALLAPGGLFLNHGITRPFRRNKKKRFGNRPEQRALQRYIFPGGELDDIGDTIRFMEDAGYEVQDVEGLREHYELTTRMWCERLTARREEAVALAGEEIYRIWVVYLAACSLAFRRGSARLYQVLATRSAKEPAPKPPTRDDIYAAPVPYKRQVK